MSSLNIYSKEQTDAIVEKKQDTLVSGENVKTINNQSIVGSGNIDISSSQAVWGQITGTLQNQTDLTNYVESVKTTIDAEIETKQDKLVSGTNIKTINNQPLLGSGNIDISGTGQTTWGQITGSLSAQTDLNNALNNKQDKLTSGSNIKTINNQSILGSGNIDISGGSGSTVWGQIVGTITAQTDLMGLINDKQDKLVSGNTIKTINGNSLLGGGNISVQTTLESGTNIKTINSNSLLGSGNIEVQPTLISGTNIKTINGSSILGQGDIIVGGSRKFEFWEFLPVGSIDHGEFTTNNTYTNRPAIFITPERSSTSAPDHPIFIYEITKQTNNKWHVIVGCPGSDWTRISIVVIETDDTTWGTATGGDWAVATQND